MSNTICIKHGENIPNDGVLQPYELGYVTSTGMLVIGNSDRTTKKLNFLQLDDDGYIPNLYSDGYLNFFSTHTKPRLVITANNSDSSKISKASYCVDGQNGRAYILSYPPGSSYCERYNLPTPSSSLTGDLPYTILTTKGGTFPGTFNFTGKTTLNELTLKELLLLNGKVVLKEGVHYGDTDPNDAKIPGEEGQIYFVLSKEGET